MAYKVVSMYVSSSKYSLKCPYSMTPQYITVHNTANDAPARNEVSYMRNNSYEVSFHVAVDDKEVVLGIPFNRNAWHCGDGGSGTGNRKSIGVEICYSKSGGSKFTAAEKNAAAYIASLLKTYGWGISRVKRHKDWNGKNCPHRTMSLGWQRFLNMVSAELDKLNNKTTSTSTTTKKTTVTKLYRVRKSWANSKSQIGAYKSLSNAKKAADKNKAAGYKVYDWSGTCVYTPKVTKTTKKTVTEIAKEIINGTCSDPRWKTWGNGTTRKTRLKAAGYNSSSVQKKVNQLMDKK